MSKYFKFGLVGLSSILSYSNRELFFIINFIRSIFDVLLQILNKYTSFSKSSKWRVCPLLTCSSAKIPFPHFGQPILILCIQERSLSPTLYFMQQKKQKICFSSPQPVILLRQSWDLYKL